MGIRPFRLNSREFNEAVSAPEERPWMPNGALPPEPAKDMEVIVDRGSGRALARAAAVTE